MADELTVSVLGTGIMGAAMARNLARAGHTVRVWNRSRDTAEALAGEGVFVADSPAAAVEGAAVVLTMLYDGQAVLDVMRQAAPGLRSGTAWVQSTTAGIDSCRELAALAREWDMAFFD
ncbi:MAG: NAD(P)-binding domain-containing protein, partial [Isosphaeraceae bacterium]